MAFGGMGRIVLIPLHRTAHGAKQMETDGRCRKPKPVAARDMTFTFGGSPLNHERSPSRLSTV